MASIFTDEEKPTIQTGLELTQSLHESKRVVIKRVPWAEMVHRLFLQICFQRYCDFLLFKNIQTQNNSLNFHFWRFVLQKTDYHVRRRM